MPKTITYTLTDDEYTKLNEMVEHVNQTLQTEGVLVECGLHGACWAGPLAEVEHKPDGSVACPECDRTIKASVALPPVYTPAAYARDALLDDLGLITDPSRPTE
jgi:hypothetical protein